MDIAKYLLQDRDEPKVATLLDSQLPAPFDMKLADVKKAGPGFRTNSGGSALHQVAGWGYVEVAKLLLKHGAEVNIATAYGRTPLHQAAGGGAKAVVSLLLEAGAEPHSVDLTNYTARELAEDGGYMEVADVLVEAEEKTPRPRADVYELDDYEAADRAAGL